MYYILLPDAVQPQLASTKKKGELASRPRQKEVLYVTKDRPCWMNVTGIFLFSFNTNVYSSSSSYTAVNIISQGKSKLVQRKCCCSE
jgi:hypothetical protein